MSEYISPEKVLDNPEYIRIPLKMDNLGGVRMGNITHYTRVVSDKDGWDEIIYFRYIGSHNDGESSKNGFGGYVYVLTNEQFPGKCKIGMTTNHPEKRLQQINNAGVVVDWNLVYHYKCSRPFDFEQTLHLKLAYCRTRNDREFFDLSSEEAILMIEELGPMFGSM
jgi:hypothetical protein